MVRRDRDREPFPASVETVCRFLGAQGRSKAPSTVRRRLYAIRKVHRLLGLPDPTYDEEINIAYRKVRRLKTVRPRQAKGMTQAYLERFLNSEPDTPWGCETGQCCPSAMNFSHGARN